MRGVRRLAAGVGGMAMVAGLTACGSGSSTTPNDAAVGGDGGGQAGATVHVVASTDVWGDVVAQIAGWLAGVRVSITSLITDPSADPHSYEASTQNQLALSRADLVVENGGGYDDFVHTMLDASGNPDATVVNAVDVSGVTAPAGGELNEHVWYDFPGVRRVAAAIEQALAKADPADAATYRSNARRFDEALAGLERTEAEVKRQHAGEGVAVTEPVPLYLLQACGLVDRTPAEFSEAVEEGNDVSLSVLHETEQLFSDHDVALLAYNEQTSSQETEAVLDAAQQAGVPVVPVTETLPAGEDYLTWMRHNLAAVRAALR